MKILTVFWKTIAWSVFMLVLFLIPAQRIPGSRELPHLDKIVHVGFFMVFTILFMLDRFQGRQLKTIETVHVLSTFLLVLFLAVSVEVLQEIMNLGREGDVIDILFDLAGFFLGFFVVLLFSLTRSRSS
jgi:VanZ family protein